MVKFAIAAILVAAATARSCPQAAVELLGFLVALLRPVPVDGAGDPEPRRRPATRFGESTRRASRRWHSNIT